jgi:hypothetical protein
MGLLLLGWKPTHPGLIEDLDEGHYFEAWRVIPTTNVTKAIGVIVLRRTESC